MAQYYQEAKELAGLFNQCHAVKTLPLEPVSNMFHVHFNIPKEKLETCLVKLYGESGIGFTGNLKESGEDTCFYEVSIGDRYGKIPKEDLKKVFQMLDERLQDIK